MAKRTGHSAPASSPPQPEIFEATLGFGGAVIKGAALTQAQAEDRRKVGLDVVICGPDVAVNRRVARSIEFNANGRYMQQQPHLKTAGPKALPHFQPLPRPPAGHTFYESAKRKAV